jgi:molybdate transport system regulatory protein
VAAVQIRIRLLREDEIAFGPGKADLMDAIAATGSISAAARKMGMSYRRAWMLIDVMNRCFSQPLVTTAVGGQQGGGAELTDFGNRILRTYRGIQEKAASAIRLDMRKLLRELDD